MASQKSEDVIPYQKVEYLQGDGESYINTKIPINDDYFEISVEFAYDTFVAWGSVYSNYLTGSRNLTRIMTGKAFDANWYSDYNTAEKGAATVIGSILPNQKTYIINNRDYTIQDGIKYQKKYFNQNYDNNNPILLFATNSIYITKMDIKLYSFKIRHKDTLLRDMIPIREGNIGYMYDKASGQLFGNLGSGKFILGPDL